MVRVLSGDLRPGCVRPDIPPLSACLPAPPTDGEGRENNDKEKREKKTPGAVQTSQLIPQQTIGCERLSVTVGPSKAEHHLLRACCDENKGRRGRRGMGAKGGRGVCVCVCVCVCV